MTWQYLHPLIFQKQLSEIIFIKYLYLIQDDIIYHLDTLSLKIQI